MTIVYVSVRDSSNAAAILLASYVCELVHCRVAWETAERRTVQERGMIDFNKFAL